MDRKWIKYLTAHKESNEKEIINCGGQLNHKSDAIGVLISP